MWRGALGRPSRHLQTGYEALHGGEKRLLKKAREDAAAVALYFMYYTFGRVHQTLHVTPAMGPGEQIMSGVLKKSLAYWVEEHGFGILCVRSPQGEHFVLVPPNRSNTGLELQDGRMSEREARAHLAGVGLSDMEVDEAVDLAREWATTVTGGWPRS